MSVVFLFLFLKKFAKMIYLITKVYSSSRDQGLGSSVWDGAFCENS